MILPIHRISPSAHGFFTIERFIKSTGVCPSMGKALLPMDENAPRLACTTNHISRRIQIWGGRKLHKKNKFGSHLWLKLLTGSNSFRRMWGRSNKQSKPWLSLNKLTWADTHRRLARKHRQKRVLTLELPFPLQARGDEGRDHKSSAYLRRSTGNDKVKWIVKLRG